eukprot:scaffold825_cov249-Pinguiococcus_pyrenoidosus.AAC.9
MQNNLRIVRITGDKVAAAGVEGKAQQPSAIGGRISERQAQLLHAKLLILQHLQLNRTDSGIDTDGAVVEANEVSDRVAAGAHRRRVAQGRQQQVQRRRRAFQL